MIFTCQLLPQLLYWCFIFVLYPLSSLRLFSLILISLITWSLTHIRPNIRYSQSNYTDGPCCEMTQSCGRACFCPFQEQQILHLEKNNCTSYVLHPSTSCLSSVTSRISSTITGYEMIFTEQQHKRNAGHFRFSVASPYFPTSTLELSSCWQIFAGHLLFHSLS